MPPHSSDAIEYYCDGNGSAYFFRLLPNVINFREISLLWERRPAAKIPEIDCYVAAGRRSHNVVLTLS